MKKSSGFISFVTGLLAGAAAVFWSDPQNRARTGVALTKVSTKVKKAREKLEADPQAFGRQLKSQGKKLAKKALRSAGRKLTKVGKTRRHSQKRGKKSKQTSPVSQ